MEEHGVQSSFDWPHVLRGGTEMSSQPRGFPWWMASSPCSSGGERGRLSLRGKPAHVWRLNGFFFKLQVLQIHACCSVPCFNTHYITSVGCVGARDAPLSHCDWSDSKKHLSFCTEKMIVCIQDEFSVFCAFRSYKNRWFWGDLAVAWCNFKKLPRHPICLSFFSR